MFEKIPHKPVYFFFWDTVYSEERVSAHSWKVYFYSANSFVFISNKLLDL